MASSFSEAFGLLTVGAVLDHKNGKALDTRKTYWMGTPPDICDLCDAPLAKHGVFYDVNTGRGWCICCDDCFINYDLRLGIGFGQKYNHETGEQLAGGRTTS